MTSPTKPTWGATVARGVQIATARRAEGKDITYAALYKDFFNSCQDVPLKWLRQFTYEVEKQLLTAGS